MQEKQNHLGLVRKGVRLDKLNNPVGEQHSAESSDFILPHVIIWDHMGAFTKAAAL
ncbi:hypothetical protein [Hymenobacter rubripertinctus]|uniref:hypothetical protein n=1 Tax=Hymenobacter rubripertinctus TaxID=2029981 RepID=UPI001603EB99|nr:hypothetical protein [Hymenobacter rubripertinctus]